MFLGACDTHATYGGLAMNANELIGMGLGAALLFAGMGNSAAQDAKAAPSKEASAAVAEQAELARKLIAYGDARNDPILLLAAAKLQRTLSETRAPASTQSFETQAVLERAKKDAKGNKEIIELADDMMAMKPKRWSIDAVSGRSVYRR